MPMPNKQTTDENYRYAFQGQEKDGETGMEAFELRLWDGRLGRWLTVDPKGQYFSPYLGMGNNPVSTIDPDGGSTEGGPGDPPVNGGTLNEVVISTTRVGKFNDIDKILNFVPKEPIFKSPIAPRYSDDFFWNKLAFDGTRRAVFGNNIYKVDNDGYAVKFLGRVPVGGEGALGFISGGGAIKFIKYTSEGIKALKSTEIAAQSVGGIAKYKKMLNSKDIYDSVASIEIIVHKGVKYIADGHHRVEAAKALNRGLEAIEYTGKEAAKRFPELYKQIVNGVFK